MSDQPDPPIRVTIRPSADEVEQLEQRLLDSGLPADGAVPLLDPDAPDMNLQPTFSDVQPGVGVVKGFTQHPDQAEAAREELIERDQENQGERADLLPD